MRLNLKAVTLTASIIWALAIFLTGIMNLIWTGYGDAFLKVIASLYPGFKAEGSFGDVIIGTNTYNYSFTTVDDYTCKIRLEEKKTDKKGKTSAKAYAFYLMDLNADAINFKTSGSSVIISMEIKQSQKFISEYG